MEEQGFTIKKKVDESWKDTVAKEKSKEAPSSPGTSTGPSPETAPAGELTFETFISGLGMQAMTALNDGKTDQARYLIDLIQMLFEKSQGNLSLEESQGLRELLYQLQLNFVKKSKTA